MNNTVPTLQITQSPSHPIPADQIVVDLAPWQLNVLEAAAQLTGASSVGDYLRSAAMRDARAALGVVRFRNMT